MSQWTQSQSQNRNEGFQAVCAVYVPEELVLLADLGLYNAGWRFTRTGAPFELHEVIGDRARFCWAREVDTVAVISPTANPNNQELADRIYADGPERADSDKLVGLLDDLFKLLGTKLYSELDLLMRSLELSRSAPEYLVGIARATSNEAHHLPHWKGFLSAVKTELALRKLDPQKILIGLL